MLPKLRFSSLYSRMLLVMVLGVGSAFLISNLIWVSYYEQKRYNDARLMAEELASSMAATVSFFGALPSDYRHIVLQQLRNMGGARFFVSVNDELLNIESLPQSPLSRLIVNEYTRVLKDKLGQKMGDIKVVFAQPEKLRVFRNEVRFVDLPDRWVQNSLVLNQSPPLLVAQLQFGGDEWLYLAALLPDPYFLARDQSLFQGQAVLVTLLLLALLMISWVVVRWLTRPLSQLARAARSLGKDIHHQVIIPEVGTHEVKETARAFNAMQERILRFVDDREHLFSAISHDLKTPITRLRLRLEMLDDDKLRQQMISDLVELEALVKGALQFTQSTDVHEELDSIDIMALLQDIQEEIELINRRLSIEGHTDYLFEGKSLALKRCLSNVIQNAVFYGNRAWVKVEDSKSELKLSIWDDGPGIPEDEMEHVLEPYVRLETSRNRNTGGTGLGLSIASNIVHAHGGRFRMANLPERGLLVEISLPRR